MKFQLTLDNNTLTNVADEMDNCDEYILKLPLSEDQNDVKFPKFHRLFKMNLYIFLFGAFSRCFGKWNSSIQIQRRQIHFWVPNNIYLICLCNSNDLKSKETDFNNIWSLIVEDIGYLENVGIDIGNNVNVKGTLSYLSYDNLGGNSSLGLIESFQAFFYCRICELAKEKCQHSSKVDPKLLRNKKTYMEPIAIVDAFEKVNFSQTKGIKRFCVLNDLKYFHFTENISVDPRCVDARFERRRNTVFDEAVIWSLHFPWNIYENRINTND